MNEFGAAIRARREEAKLSQKTLAKMIGVDDKTIYRIECGDQKVAFGTVLKVCETLEVKVLFKKRPLYMG